MAQSKIKPASKHKNNIATPAKREYRFFDVAKIVLPKADSVTRDRSKFINSFLLQADATFSQPEIIVRG